MAEPIILESMRGANVALIARIQHPNGAAVKAGDLLFEIENHKVVQEVESPLDGVLVHSLAEGQFAPLGKAIAFVVDANDDVEKLAHSLDNASGETGPDWPEMICDTPSESGSSAGQPVSVAKATEIAVLGNGPAQSLQASLGVMIGPVSRSAATPSFFQDKILDLMVYECSRLLSSSPFSVLNSRFADGKVIAHDSVNPGISFDEGGRLTLYSLADANRLSLAEVQDKILDGLMRYVAQRLDLAEVASSTFTISDVTVAPLNFSVPLVPRDQSMIVVLTRSAAGDYALNISFDHRVTEGLLVTNFAQELAERIRSYTDLDQSSQSACCAYCDRSAEEEYSDFRRRGLLRIVGRDGDEVLCCAACWEGW